MATRLVSHIGFAIFPFLIFFLGCVSRQPSSPIEYSLIEANGGLIDRNPLTGETNVYLLNEPLSDKMVRWLEKIPQLHGLLLTNNQNVNDFDINRINQLQHLKGLSIYGTSITKNGICNIDLPELAWLEIGKIKEQDAQKDSFEVVKLCKLCKKLTSLIICDCNLSDEDFDFINEKIQDLDLSGTNVADNKLKFISRLKALKHLSLKNNPIRGDCLEHLSLSRNIRKLDLSSTFVEDDHIIFLKNLSNLETLDLSHTGITDNGIEKLTLLPKLNTLDLSYNPDFSDVGISHLVKIPSIQNLDVRSTSISNAGMIKLVNLPFLRQLSIQGTNVTKRGVILFGKKRSDISLKSDY